MLPVVELLPITRRYLAGRNPGNGGQRLSYVYLVKELVRLGVPAAITGRVIPCISSQELRAYDLTSYRQSLVVSNSRGRARQGSIAQGYDGVSWEVLASYSMAANVK